MGGGRESKAARAAGNDRALARPAARDGGALRRVGVAQAQRWHGLLVRLAGMAQAVGGVPGARRRRLSLALALLLMTVVEAAAGACLPVAWAVSLPAAAEAAIARPKDEGPAGRKARASTPGIHRPLGHRRQWATHRSSLRRVVRWPACRPGAPPGTCGRRGCESVVGLSASHCEEAMATTRARIDTRTGQAPRARPP